MISCIHLYIQIYKSNWYVKLRVEGNSTLEVVSHGIRRKHDGDYYFFSVHILSYDKLNFREYHFSFSLLVACELL